VPVSTSQPVVFKTFAEKARGERIALWKYVTAGVVIEGVVMKAA
jgi:hypothetical protein